MKFRTVLGLLIVLICCSCNQQTSKNGQQIDNDPNKHFAPKSGLLIDNEIRRGISYTDPLGSNYNLRYIPITITNDSTIRMHLQIAFSKEYDYLPRPDFNEKFKLIPMPKEWADTISITEGMIDEIKNYMEKPSINETIEPGEKFILAIGTLYGNPTTCGIIPTMLFSQSDSDNFPACDNRMIQDKSTNPQLALGIKLDFCESCLLIPCGQISYPEH